MICMGKIIHILAIFIIIVCLLSWKAPVKDENFSRNGDFIVKCLNEKKSTYSNDGYYYYRENSFNICRYSTETGKKETVFQSHVPIDYYIIWDGYVYYNYLKEYDVYQLNKYNIETGQEECILDADVINCDGVDIYGGYFYILTNNYNGLGGRVYRCPLGGNPETDCEDLSEVFQKESMSGETITVEQDGLLIDGFYFEEKDAYYIQSLREQGTNRFILTKVSEEVLVDGKRVNIKTNGKKPMMRFSYQVEGKTEMPIICLNQSRYDRSELYEQYMIQEGEDTIIGLLSVADDPRVSIEMVQGDIRRDLLFQLNIETGESKILYDTKNNLTRIIGYDEGVIYLFKDDYKVYSQSLAGGELKELLALPEAEDIVFDWQGDYLIVRYINEGGNEYNVVSCLK